MKSVATPPVSTCTSNVSGSTGRSHGSDEQPASTARAPIAAITDGTRATGASGNDETGERVDSGGWSMWRSGGDASTIIRPPPSCPPEPFFRAAGLGWLLLCRQPARLHPPRHVAHAPPVVAGR